MIGFYAGSFDPFTNGHLAIVKKACSCFEKVVIGIGDNTQKTRRIKAAKMKSAIEETLRREKIENAIVVIYQGLTTQQAKENKADILIRGLRNGTDYQYEENIAMINEQYAGLDTCYFRAGDLGYLSSSMVMELYSFGKSVQQYVPQAVSELLEKERSKR